MKQVANGTMTNNDYGIDALPLTTLLMDKICPVIHTNAPSQFFKEFFKNHLVGVNLKNIVIKTVGYFSKSEFCTILAEIDANVSNDELIARELLDRMLYQVYRGIPYCEIYSNIKDNTNHIKSDRLTHKPSFLKIHQAIPEDVGFKARLPQTTTVAGTPKPGVTTYRPGYRAWLATLAAIVIISVISVAMIVIMGLKKNMKVYKYILEFFVATAVAALLTDSLLHLYPHSLGIHHHGDDDNHGDESIYSSSNHLWKGILIIATLYIFYLIEYLMLIVPKYFGNHLHCHRHDHGNFKQGTQEAKNEVISNQKNESITLIDSAQAQLPNSDCASIDLVKHKSAAHNLELTKVEMDCDGKRDGANDDAQTTINSVAIVTENLNFNDNITSGDKPPTTLRDDVVPTKSGFLAQMREVKKVVWMLTIGDTLHNCIDGIFIATQFMEDWPKGLFTGIMTSVAILCHEVPHEVGDCATMLSSGLSIKKAIFFNFVATLSCMLGGVIGCCLGSSGRAVWIEPIVAGIFIYISLSILMPNLVKSLESINTRTKFFLCHTFGYLFGSTILIIIAFHEESLMSIKS